MIQFKNNTAHSNGVHGLRIYPKYTPYVGACNNVGITMPQYFHNFTTFHNGASGIFGKRDGDLHHINLKTVENGGDEVSWVILPDPKQYGWDAHIKDSLFVCTTDPVGRPCSKGGVGLRAPQDGA